MIHKRSQTVHLLRWVNQYPGWWYLICTPENGHMSLHTVQTLLRQLHKADLDELILVLLMVHRDAPWMKTFFPYMLLERLIDRWDADREKILADLIAHFD